MHVDGLTLKLMLKGFATYIPGLYRFASKGTGGTISARYCYSVWLRHLMMAHKNKLPTRLGIVAELGPGDSLGIGLAAMLSGVDRYYAFDVVRHSETTRNLSIFNELVELFQRREDIPDNAEFPKVEPLLDLYDFPRNILDEDILGDSLRHERVESLRGAILAAESGKTQNRQIVYCVPWHESEVIREGSVDMVYSQACMQYVDNLEFTYQTLYRWLKPGGFMSHEISFGSHGTANEWSGHWGYSDIVWKSIRGARPYFINREPLSTHIELILRAGFQLVCEKRTNTTSGIRREELTSRFANISDLDLTTCTAFIQAVK